MKNILKRFIQSGAFGISIGFLIILFGSLIKGDGNFYIAAPSTINQFGSEVNAALAQTIGTFIVGGTFGLASLVNDRDDYSIAKQTAIHFLITAPTMMVIAYVLRWMERSAQGILIYFIVFVTIYFLSWLGQYLYWKNQLKDINKGLK